MELTIFTQLGLVIAIAAVISFIMHLLRQPLIMGYIITGILVGPSVLGLIQGSDAHHAFETFSEIGIALLLFIIGLGLNAGVIKSLGKVSVATASSILVVVGAGGFFISTLLGFDVLTSVFIGIALFFSSTIIILKALSDKHETGRLYGQIAIGVVLVDDIVATLALVAVAMLATGDSDIATFGLLGLKAVGLIAGLYIAGRYLIPKIGKTLASSSELLFLFSIGWGLSVAALFDLAGFSHELGALFAGVSLAGLPYAMGMAAKLKPLRDFFLVLFFVYLGELFTFDKFVDALLPAHLLAALVMIGKPLFVMATLGRLGYTKQTSFKTAIHLSQISEFSIILIIFGATSGVLSQSAVPIITMVALITIGLSTYMIKYESRIYKKLEKYLDIFERKQLNEPRTQTKPFDAILFGYHKGGREYVDAFRDMKMDYLVVDDNPEIIDRMNRQSIRNVYGDMIDEEFLVEIGAANAKIFVSTLESITANLSALSFVRHHSKEASFICQATNYDDAVKLYEHGASYVSLPHYIGSERVSNYIKRHGIDHKSLGKYRDRHANAIMNPSKD